jgi:hypothetical protein
MTHPLSSAIEGLCSAEVEARVAAAMEVYRAGRAQADHAIFPWWSDAELTALLAGPHATVTVGLAVTRETFGRIREANGSPRLAQVPPEQDAEEFELHLPGGISLDILTTREPDGAGAIAKYLVKFGEDIQQIELRCANVGRAAEILRERFGIASVYPAARAGANDTRVNFFLVSAPGAGKVLIELYEPAPSME